MRILAAALLIAACSSGGGSRQPQDNGHSPEAADNTLIEATNGGTVDVHVGQTFGFTLGSNETTGYSWRIAEQPPFLHGAGSRYIGPQPRPDGEIATGAGGSQLFRFVAERAGEGTLRLEYRGPGVDEQLASTFELHVRAR